MATFKMYPTQTWAATTSLEIDNCNVKPRVPHSPAQAKAKAQARARDSRLSQASDGLDKKNMHCLGGLAERGPGRVRGLGAGALYREDVGGVVGVVDVLERHGVPSALLLPHLAPVERVGVAPNRLLYVSRERGGGGWFSGGEGATSTTLFCLRCCCSTLAIEHAFLGGQTRRGWGGEKL